MIATALILVALILALVDQFRAHGQALTTWAVALIAAALLLGRFA